MSERDENGCIWHRDAEGKLILIGSVRPKDVEQVIAEMERAEANPYSPAPEDAP